MMMMMISFAIKPRPGYSGKKVFNVFADKIEVKRMLITRCVISISISKEVER